MTKAENTFEKLARIYGALSHEYLDPESSLPKHLQEEGFHEYLGVKAKESPTSILKATAGGIGGGALVGYAFSQAANASRKSKNITTAGTAAIGAAIANFLRKADSKRIDDSKVALTDKQMMHKLFQTDYK